MRYTKWEYEIRRHHPANMKTVLEELGEQGWELVNVEYPVAPASTPVELIFKRPGGSAVPA